MMKEALDTAFIERSLELEIKAEIKKSIDEAVHNISKSYAVRDAVEQMVTQAILLKTEEIRHKKTSTISKKKVGA